MICNWRCSKSCYIVIAQVSSLMLHRVGSDGRDMMADTRSSRTSGHQERPQPAPQMHECRDGSHPFHRGYANSLLQSGSRTTISPGALPARLLALDNFQDTIHCSLVVSSTYYLTARSRWLPSAYCYEENFSLLSQQPVDPKTSDRL